MQPAVMNFDISPNLEYKIQYGSSVSYGDTYVLTVHIARG